MSKDNPEVGDVWCVNKSPDVHNFVIDTSDCRGYVDFIHCYQFPKGKWVALCKTEESNYFLNYCKYLGKAKCSISDLFEVKE